MEFVVDWRFILVLIIGLIGTILAVKVRVNFDLNKWSESRREQRVSRLRDLCPHMIVEQSTTENEFIGISTFSSPAGTTAWLCSLCGIQTWDRDYVRRVHRYWLDNPKQLATRFKEIDDLKRKLGRK